MTYVIIPVFDRKAFSSQTDFNTGNAANLRLSGRNLDTPSSTG